MIRKEMFWNISFNKPTAPHMVLDPRETEAKIQVLLLTRTSACTERYRSVLGLYCMRDSFHFFPDSQVNMVEIVVFT